MLPNSSFQCHAWWHAFFPSSVLLSSFALWSRPTLISATSSNQSSIPLHHQSSFLTHIIIIFFKLKIKLIIWCAVDAYYASTAHQRCVGFTGSLAHRSGSNGFCHLMLDQRQTALSCRISVWCVWGWLMICTSISGLSSLQTLKP